MALEPAGIAAAAIYALLLLLPGLALLSLFGPRLRDPVMACGLAAGLGLAFYPLLFLWADVVGISLGRGSVMALAVASAAVVLYRAVSRRKAIGPDEVEAADIGTDDTGDWNQARDWAPWLAAVVVFVAVLASRLWAVHDVSVPLWGDSVHHTMIVRLLSTGGGLVDSWEPLAPLSSFTYHFGLHSGVASLVWLTGLPEHRALLVAGQVLSALQVLTAYALVAGLTRRPWAGVGAAIAVGGLSPMPAYYVNWGRYTQLAGQVLLPAASLLAVWAATGTADLMARDSDVAARGMTARDSGVAARATTNRKSSLRLGAAAAIAVGGLALTHYLVALMFGLFALAWLVVSAGGFDRLGIEARARALVRLVGVAVAAAALALSWLARMWDSVIARAAKEMIGGGLEDADVYGVVSPESVWDDFSLLVGTAMIGVVVVAAVWGIARRERTVWLGLAWAGLLLVAAYPGAIGLSMTPPLKDFTVAIGLYLPASLVVGGAMGDVMSVAQAAKPAAVWAALAVVAVLAVALAWKDRDPVASEHVLVTPADEQAMTWLRDETPTDSVFLVSCLMAFGGTVCAGDDAGWWIPLLADRDTTVPPVTYGVETASDPGYVADVNRLADLWHSDLHAPDTVAAMDEAGVTHAYLGATATELDRAQLAASALWTIVYDRDGVQVFARDGLDGLDGRDGHGGHGGQERRDAQSDDAGAGGEAGGAP